MGFSGAFGYLFLVAYVAPDADIVCSGSNGCGVGGCGGWLDGWMLDVEMVGWLVDFYDICMRFANRDMRLRHANSDYDA